MLPRFYNREAAGKAGLVLRLRQAIALPLYVLLVLMVFGCLVAGMAGDDWAG
jgi:uncharacterized membrane protein